MRRSEAGTGVTRTLRFGFSPDGVLRGFATHVEAHQGLMGGWLAERSGETAGTCREDDRQRGW